jgi:hypothetical protein
MDSISWGLVLVAGALSGVAGAFLFSRRATVLQSIALCWLRFRQCVQAPQPHQPQHPAIGPAQQWRAPEDTMVLIPDGRPWPLGAAVQLLELAWRWQVAHGTNLPLRARQGEGAYVWRPPLPARTSSDQHAIEAER